MAPDTRPPVPCPLCGARFDPAAAGSGCRSGCALASGCKVHCCPACGYSFPEETGLAARLRRLLQRRGTQETP